MHRLLKLRHPYLTSMEIDSMVKLHSLGSSGTGIDELVAAAVKLGKTNG